MGAPLPVRQAGALGAMPDIDPRDAPMEAWTMAVNVRFQDGKITRGPVWRVPGNPSDSPRLMFSTVDVDGTLLGFYAGLSGSVYSWQVDGVGITDTDVSPTGYSPVTSELPTTFTETNGVMYVNRQDHLLWYYSKPTSTEFDEIDNGVAPDWPTALRARVVRSVGGQVVMLNLSDGGGDYPTDVAWSNYTVYGTQPPDWDFGNPASRAGRNTLADLGEPILDGATLKAQMYLFSQSQTWLMQPTGDNDVFAFNQIFSDKGILATNCVVEAEGLLYVFGSDDIWMTDGISPKSISSGKVRRHIFNSLITAKKDSAFAFYHRKNKTIWFCYQANEAYARWNPVTGSEVGCNRVAAYSILDGTWSFYDAPFITSAQFAFASVSLDWEDVETSWDTTEGSWAGASDTAIISLFVSHVAETLTGEESPGISNVSSPDDSTAYGESDTSLTSPVLLLKLHMDLDEIAAGKIKQHKYISNIYPEIAFNDYSAAFQFRLGGTMVPSYAPTWDSYRNFTPDDYKVDVDTGGRFVSMEIISNTYAAFTFNGYDFDIVALGNI